MNCISKTNSSYEALQQRLNGLSDLELNIAIRNYRDRYFPGWRQQYENQKENAAEKMDNSPEYFPSLLDIPGADSQKYLADKTRLNITTQGDNLFGSTEDLLEFTGATSINQAMMKLNSIYNDVEISIVPLTEDSESVVYEFKKKPNIFEEQEYRQLGGDTESVNSQQFLGMQLDRFRNLYGININFMTTSELTKALPENSFDASAKAFIQNGEIYVNADNATIDSPVHELLHMLLGSARTTSKFAHTYFNIISKIPAILGEQQYQFEAMKYPNRSQQDINEEIFVEQFALYLTGQSNIFENPQTDEILEEAREQVLGKIQKDLSYMLDTLLMGKRSVQLLPETELAIKPLRELGLIVESSTMKNQDMMEASQVHRLAQNAISIFKVGNEKLLKDIKFEEVCS